MSFCDIVVDACPRSDLFRTLEQARGMLGSSVPTSWWFPMPSRLCR